MIRVEFISKEQLDEMLRRSTGWTRPLLDVVLEATKRQHPLGDAPLSAGVVSTEKA